MKKYIVNLSFAIILNVIIIFLIYLYVQPDPKGIGFGILSFAYVCLHGISAIALLISNTSPSRFIYSFVLCGTFLFFYSFFQVIETCFFDQFDYSTQFSILHIIPAIGVILFIWLMIKWLKDLWRFRKAETISSTI
jgi:hypothetical protein